MTLLTTAKVSPFSSTVTSVPAGTKATTSVLGTVTKPSKFTLNT